MTQGNGIKSVHELPGWDLNEFETHRRGAGISAVTLNSEIQTVKTWLEYLQSPSSTIQHGDNSLAGLRCQLRIQPLEFARRHTPE